MPAGWDAGMVTRSCCEVVPSFEPYRWHLSLWQSPRFLPPFTHWILWDPTGSWGGKEASFPSPLQVAVKLSGWRWRGQQALRVHPRGELDAVADTVLALLEKLEEEESVLVEAVCPPARLPFPGESPRGQPAVGARLTLPAALCRAQVSLSFSRQSPTWP